VEETKGGKHSDRDAMNRGPIDARHGLTESAAVAMKRGVHFIASPLGSRLFITGSFMLAAASVGAALISERREGPSKMSRALENRKPEHTF